MQNKEIHFFDLDNTLWEIEAKVRLFAKDKPQKPLLRLSTLEFQPIDLNKYKEDDIQITYNNYKFYISQEMFDKINKKRKLEPDQIGISFREFYDPYYFQKVIFLFKNILHLNNKNTDIGILTARYNQTLEKEYLNGLRKELNKLNLDINKIYYVGDKFHRNYSDHLGYEKLRVLTEHLIGIKIKKDHFLPLKQDWYQKVYFYDDEPQNIYTAINIQDYINELIQNTEDEVFNIIEEKISKNDLLLYTNQIMNNELNKFKTTKIEINKPDKFPLKVESNNLIKKFKEFK